MSTNGHASRLITPTANVIIPKAMIVLPHGKEINCIPKLPISKPEQLIREDTEPVSPFCCSNIRFAEGGRMQLPAVEAGSIHSAKIHGWRFPRIQIRSPLVAIVAKQAHIILTALKRRDSLRNIIGPAIIPKAISEK